ncbi:hypothetical protein JX266_007403 [Neoarthrinium moseri]|nr:hypothetical protein JX266_007403 [Neoarthrinium moseri]
MAVATHSAVPPPLGASEQLHHAGLLSSMTPQVQSINDLVVDSVRKYGNLPFVGYPASPLGKDDYVFYTYAELDSFVDKAAWNYAAANLKPETSAEAEVVALLAPSNLDYAVSMLALSRMGFAVLYLSTRLAPEAYVNLLKETKCTKIVLSRSQAPTVHTIKEIYPLDCYNIIEEAAFRVVDPLTPRFPAPRPSNISRQVSFIVHSSGSTGLPKPIFQTHQACIANYSSGIPYRAFLTLPLFHNHGIATLLRVMYSGRQVALYNSSLPLSSTNLVKAMGAVQPESLHCVPYALKLLAESQEGINTLKRCKLVLFGGSSCPDDLGDQLVANGVYLVGHYGATEMGQLMTSFRDEADKAWNYMRPLASAKDHVRMFPIGDGTFECVVLDGLPSKVLSNSNEPPNSYHTRDIFVPHPTIPDAWKYISRLDDRVTLVNGEKVLPIPYEHYIRQNELVQEAVVFGVGKAVPGLIIIPSQKARGINKTELLERVASDINAANARAEAFGRITPEMVYIADIGTPYPRTDKGTVIRARFYRDFSHIIDQVYELFESPFKGEGQGELVLGIDELKEYLLKLFSDRLGGEGLSSSTDFFETGVDSLQAITARAQIMREINLDGHVLGQNVVFEYPSVNLLAAHLYSLRTNTGVLEETEEDLMANLIEKYSDFSERVPGKHVISQESLIITGTTGSLGAHMLSQAVRLPTVQRIYCLVRALSPEEAMKRVLSTLEAKCLPSLSAAELSKVICLPSDLSQATLGLSTRDLDELRRTLTCVIHSAWAVNFNMGVRSFESHHIRGTYNLLNLCLGTGTTTPARFYFCSSISAAGGTPIPARVKETYVANPTHAQPMGYARSKYVTEHIVKAAAEKTGMTAKVLRLGQIIGDTDNGIWNLTEAIPLMIRSAHILKALPALEETPSWMPVDEMAKACLELSGVLNDNRDARAHNSDLSTVYQVQNRRLFHWTRELLPALRSAGIDFEIVSKREWIDRLRKSDPDPVKNPTIKLLDFFAGKYDNDNPGREGLVFETHLTERASETVKAGFDLIQSDLVQKMVAWWKTQWLA